VAVLQARDCQYVCCAPVPLVGAHSKPDRCASCERRVGRRLIADTVHVLRERVPIHSRDEDDPCAGLSGAYPSLVASRLKPPQTFSCRSHLASVQSRRADKTQFSLHSGSMLPRRAESDL
jgi:hypothetical protein